MNTLLKRAAASIVLLALAIPAQAGEYIKLKDGTAIRGEGTAYDEATNSLSFKMEDGSTRKFSMDELDHRSVYLVAHSRVPKDDAVKQIRIANLARDCELFAHAVRHYEYAVKADPSKRADVDREVAVLKQRAATWGMARAQEALAKGDKAEAEKWLMKLVEKVPDEAEGKQAAALLDERYTQRRAELESKAQEKASDQFKKDVAVGKRAYDELVANTKKGLTSKDAGSDAVKSFEAAIKDGGRALKELDKLDKKYADTETAATLVGYRKVVVDQVVETQLHLASVLTTRSSYKDALAAANQALALDPKSEAAMAARARIEQAASERGGWLW